MARHRVKTQAEENERQARKAAASAKEHPPKKKPAASAPVASDPEDAPTGRVDR